MIDRATQRSADGAADPCPAPADLDRLRGMVAVLLDRINVVETRAEAAEREAHLARDQVVLLRDEVAAAQRDQQDLKTARARLARLEVRGLLAKMFNRRR